MSSATTSKGLVKPGDADYQDAAVLGANYDRLNDFGMGPFVCTSTTRPVGANLWDGMLIWETDTKRLMEYNAVSTNWNVVKDVLSDLNGKARWVLTGSPSVASVTATLVNFDTGTGVDANFYSNAAGDYTVVKPGTYNIFSRLLWDTFNGGRRYFVCVKNGMLNNTGALSGTHVASSLEVIGTSTVVRNDLVSEPVNLAANDVLRFYAFQDSGSSISLIPGSDATLDGTSFLSIIKVG